MATTKQRIFVEAFGVEITDVPSIFTSKIIFRELTSFAKKDNLPILAIFQVLVGDNICRN